MTRVRAAFEPAIETHPSLGMRSAAVGGASLTLTGPRRRRDASASALAFSRASTAAYSAWITAVSDDRGCPPGTNKNVQADVTKQQAGRGERERKRVNT